jgi:endonuclease/exonuclease/phosphatase family metal-dependent hydrolase
MKKCFLVLLLAVPACATPTPTRTETFAEAQIDPAEGSILVAWDQSDGLMGRNACVYGRVVSANTPRDRCFLNFHEDYRTHFSASIDSRQFHKFPGHPDQLFANKRVLVQGLIDGELGRPQMTITSPEQITIIPEDVEDVAAFARQRYRGLIEPDAVDHGWATRLSAGIVRVGTYNVLNLFDEFNDPYRSDDVMDTKPRDELLRVARRIRELDADVLALQEVENREYLQRFVRALLPDMGYDHVVLYEGNNNRGIDCAVLSRLPIGPVTSHRHLRFPGPDGKTYRFLRDLLKVKIEGPDELGFDLFVVHLKSKYGGAKASEPARQAESGAIRQIVYQIFARDPQSRFIIAGDFNDYWDSPSLEIIRGSGPTQLVCPGTSLTASERITYNREQKYWSMIDFIICSPAMRDYYVEGSYKIIAGTVEDSGSDHNPSVATFSFRP